MTTKTNYYTLLQPLLFRLDPELAHKVALTALNWAPRWLVKKEFDAYPVVKAMGLTFPNPIGIAAGLDKDGDYIDGLAKLGFGFIEVGTTTPKPQIGNPKPRLFRLPQSQAIINRMGFNNKGVDYLINRLQCTRYQGIIGVNIGKNLTTPLERATEDYLTCLIKVYPYASYITVNISSPNTPNLRQLQFGEELDTLLQTLKAKQIELAETFQRYVPLAVKISPDLTAEEVQTLANKLAANQVDGVIATNTTQSRDGIESEILAKEAGGLSGKPLTQRATTIITQLHQHLPKEIPIIGVGGVMNRQDVDDKLAAGASLVQVYTGLVYGF